MDLGGYRCLGAYECMGMYRCGWHMDIGVYRYRVYRHRGHTDLGAYQHKGIKTLGAYRHMVGIWVVDGCVGHMDIWGVYRHMDLDGIGCMGMYRCMGDVQGHTDV